MRHATIKTTTAFAALLALGLAGPAAAQQTGQEATDGDAQIAGQAIEEAIEEADAPDIAETDPMGEGTETGTDGQTQQTQQAQGQGSDAATGGEMQQAEGQTPQAGDQSADTAGTQMQQAEGQQQAGEDGQAMSGAEMPEAATGRFDDMAEGVGPTVMLDVEAFSQRVYERGFRQGYIAGVTDTQQEFASQMAEVREQRAERREQMQRQQQTGERGSIIVLPPGVTPEMFVERLMQRSEGG